MKILCVAEKPSMAKNLAQILSGGNLENRQGKDKFCRNYDFQYRLPGYTGMVDMVMTSVRGHLTESDFDPQYNDWRSCDPASLFDAPILTKLSKDASGVGLNLRNEARGADAVMIWTDCDREGEHIGSEVVVECRKAKRGIKVMRARFSAIIPNQIHRACQNTVELDWRSAEAVEVRIQLDLRVGAAFTRLQTMTLQSRLPELNEQRSVISYGPCQFPTLGFVVDQYEKVRNFVPEPFWYISVTKDRRLNGHGPGPDDHPDSIKTVQFTWSRGHLFDRVAAVVLLEDCVLEPEATVTRVQSKETRKLKPYSLTTVELQKSGSRLLRLAPKRILDIAESLYQKGFLSYPRTETDQYDKDFDFRSLIEKQTTDQQWGEIAQRLNAGEFQRPRNGKKDDKAHPPIHPTSHANNLTGDDKRVYDYVTRRFLGSCWKDAIGRQTTVEISIAQESFKASGLTIQERNYLDVFTFDRWEGTLLPEFHQGEQFMPTVCELKEGKTSRPKLLTEADLVNLMDKNGIGTDATIAEHISKVIDRNYVIKVKEGRTEYLVPSTLGIGLIEGYNRINFEKSLSKPLLRRETEYRMSLICLGQRTKQETIQESVEEYRAVFAMAKREFSVIAETVQRYLRDPNAGQEARVAQLADEDGPEDGEDDSFDDDEGGTGRGPATARGRGRGSRGGAASRGTTTGGRGRGAAPSMRPPPPRGNGSSRPARDESDEDDDEDDNDPWRAGPSRPTGASAARANGGVGRNGSSGPTCSCGQSAAERTVAKEGPNKGRKFWKCPKQRDDGNCDFFEWSDGQANSAVPAKRSTPISEANVDRYRTFDQDDIGNDGGLPRCKCGMESKIGTVFKESPNQGRKFYTCRKEMKKLQCGFFEWKDDMAQPASSSVSGQCFKCGESGHWSSDCPNGRRNERPKKRAKKTGGKSKGSGGDGCFKCGKKGHWASDCPDQ